MDQGDIIRITDVQVMDGYTREMLNVYYYYVFTLTAPIELQIYKIDLAGAFKLQVMDQVRLLQTSGLQHKELRFFNMTNQTEEAVFPFSTPLPGLAAGEYPPGNLSYSFRLQRYNRLTRNGRKGIPGVTDTIIGSGRILNPAYGSLISTVSAALGESLVVEGDTSDALMSPVIVRVPANPGVIPTVWNTVTEAVFRGFGTQNSRKEL